MAKSGFMKDAVTLFAITLVAGVCLGGVYEITKAPIAAAQEQAKQNAYKTVFAEADKFEANETMTGSIAEANEKLLGLDYGNVYVIEAVDAVDASGNVIGQVVSSSSKDGFGGEVKVSVGVASDGTVKGIEFLSLSETAGLGMKAKDDSFKSQYSNKAVDVFTVTKTGSTKDSEINAISGATITSKAVTGAVNAATFFAANYAAK